MLNDLSNVPVGSFFEGKVAGPPREGYEWEDTKMFVAYRYFNGDVGVILSDGKSLRISSNAFVGKAVEKPHDWRSEMKKIPIEHFKQLKLVHLGMTLQEQQWFCGDQ